MSFAIDSLREQPVASSVWPRSRRPGFTLVELLVSIVIIAILAGLVFGALQRAGSTAKVVRTKSTIAKLNASLMDRWDSYRNRRLPTDPNFILAKIKATGGTAYPWVQQQIALMSQRRIAYYAAAGIKINGQAIVAYPGTPTEPLSIPYGAGTNYPNSDLIAAVRLLAIREMMQYEMPQHVDDFVDFGSPASPTPPWSLKAPQVLSAAPPIATTYLMMVNKAGAGDPNADPPRPPATISQIRSNDSAECLYMILTLGSTDSAFSGEQLPTRDVGDVDGDGLPEFQDAWPVALNSYTAIGQANSPINFLRWAPGFVSDFQPDQSSLGFYEFSLAHHDFFDPLKLDVPGGSPLSPRGFQLTPLIYSAGPDGVWDIDQGPTPMADPYDATGVLAGTIGPRAADDVTNHDLDTRTGR